MSLPNEYVGSGACLPCHRSIVESQSKTPMAATLFWAKDSAVLRSHPVLSFSAGPYRYEIKSERNGSTYFVTDGVNTLVETLSWAFGSGPVGQSFLFARADGNLYEARVSYFESLRGLGATPGFTLASTANFNSSAYRAVPSEEIIRCFSCHSTGSTIGGSFDVTHLILGISCEACHRPGKQHVTAMTHAKTRGITFDGKTHIYNPAGLKPAYSVDFCGACHGAYWDVALMPIQEGLETTRFQPYRLQQSKCWGKDGDSRLTCVSCHDPHQPLNANIESYDKVCLSCHRTSGNGKHLTNSPGPSCPVGTVGCSSCHMPTTYFPGMHQSFRDHLIQIAPS